jgi:hypothetical protein
MHSTLLRVDVKSPNNNASSSTELVPASGVGYFESIIKQILHGNSLMLLL